MKTNSLAVARRLMICLTSVISLSQPAFADCADTLAQLIGYTIVASTHVTGDFQGAEYDKLVELDNNMIFRFRTYHYHYSYHPDAVVFAMQTTYAERSFMNYKLLIDDDIYDVTRVR